MKHENWENIINVACVSVANETNSNRINRKITYRSQLTRIEKRCELGKYEATHGTMFLVMIAAMANSTYIIEYFFTNLIVKYCTMECVLLLLL